MRIIVAHPEQQHSYHLAAALKKAGILEKYITTVYWKKHNLTGIVAWLLRGKYKIRAKSRHCNELNDKDVLQFSEGMGLIKLLCSYVPFLRKYYMKIRIKTSDGFARKVAEYAINNNVDAVITYDNCSPLLFSILKENAPDILRIMDMSAANLMYMKDVYEKDFLLAPSFANRLREERSYIWDTDYMDRYEAEIKNSQYFLVPSSIVQKSLLFSGIQQECMMYCPYGVDVSSFSAKHSYKSTKGRPIEFIFVGGVKELKGIYYLLESFKGFSTEVAHLTVVGATGFGCNDLEVYKDVVTFTGLVLHNEIPNLLKNADVFVFPSLGDSFALAALEAAACGLPLIVSKNTGMSDLMIDGEEGFIIKEQSVDAIKQAIQWFIDNPNEIPNMGKKARKLAVNTTWEKYDYTIQNLFANNMA